MTAALVVSGVTYGACFAEVEPTSVTPVGRGFRATLHAQDDGEREALIEHMIETASDLAWDAEKTGVVEAIYKDVERNDLAVGRPAMA